MLTLEEIKKLSDVELISNLKKYGANTGPVTATTRILFENKLYQLETGAMPANEKQSEQVVSADVKPSVGKEATSGPLQYYAIQIPVQAQAKETAECCVCTERKEALQLMKQYPGSRFKMFNDKDLAIKHASQPIDLIPQSPVPDLNAKSNSSSPGSEGSSFRGPKPPEIIQFRRHIEQGNVEEIKKTVWANPRYLISSGDTPVILQENFRYNALHVCANKNQVSSAETILDLLHEEEIFKLMYPDDTAYARKERIQFITDLYLNTPDKGVNETPLHFACKFGHAEVVRLLMNQKGVDTSRKNKFGEQPRDIVCNRMRSGRSTTKSEILDLLKGLCYVPLMRAVDESRPAQVVHPMPPSQVKQKLEPEECTVAKEAPLAIRAMAGPMSPVQAEKFRRTWTTPPSPSQRDKSVYTSIRRGDPSKGMERIGRQLAHNLHVDWTEYWDFLGELIDLSTPEGLAMLEEFLRKQSQELRKALNLTSITESSQKQPFTAKSDRSICDSRKNNDTTGSLHSNPFMPQSLLSTIPLDDSVSSVKTSTPKKGDTASFDAAASLDDSLCEALRGLSLSSPKKPVSYSSQVLSLSSDVKDGECLNVNANSNNGHESDVCRSSSVVAEDDSTESDSEESDYATANESSDDDFEETFDFQNEAVLPVGRLYLFGQEPSKTDVDVLRAIESVPISPVTYPYIFKWKNNVTCFSEKSRTRWTTTPIKLRLSRSTPAKQRSIKLPLSTSKPRYSLLPSSSPVVHDDDDDEDGPISFSASTPSFSADDSMNRIRTNLTPQFQSSK